MSYTFTEHTGDGRTVTFPFRFAGRDKGYLRATDIVVEQKIGELYEVMQGWALTGTNQITFTVAPVEGIKFRIRRVVAKEYPYAEFDRGVILDMKSLNDSFIHLLEITQELLDGFFPEGYFVKQHINMGGFQIQNLGDGTQPDHAVNKGQLDAVDEKHTEWNERQDVTINGIIASLTSDVAQRTIPWYYTAKGGEHQLLPPYVFRDCMVFINGVFQHQLTGAYTVANNVVTLAEPLLAGDEVYLLIGSRPASPEVGTLTQWQKDVNEGDISIDIGTNFSYIRVYLDGLYQPPSVYSINKHVIRFNEALPACTVSAEFVQA